MIAIDEEKRGEVPMMDNRQRRGGKFNAVGSSKFMLVPKWKGGSKVLGGSYRP
jgi:hypothetical protein